MVEDKSEEEKTTDYHRTTFLRNWLESTRSGLDQGGGGSGRPGSPRYRSRSRFP